MNEVFPSKSEVPVSQEKGASKDVEKPADISEGIVAAAANYEGNFSEAQFDRMRNPEIRSQLIDLFHREQLARYEYLHTEPFELDFVMGNGEKILKDQNGKQISESDLNAYIPKSEEDIERELNERLKEIMVVTPIEFSNKGASTGSIGIFAENEYTDERLTTKQQSLMEAHEKGHELRRFGSEFFRQYFSKGFDFSKVVLRDEDIQALFKNPELTSSADSSRESMQESLLEYISSGSEIAERMGQLKNYFGMKGGEKFTRKHLAYARKHYLEDVGYDNNMSHFFEAITPETEDNFIELINSSGI